MSHKMLPGLGISAFPSVHVSVATVVALYLAERSRWLILPGLAYLGAVQFLSVYTGFHYAVDGYFSILFVTGLWAALRTMRLTELALWPARPGLLVRLPPAGVTMHRSGAEQP